MSVETDLYLVTEYLRRFYTASETERWLISPNQLLNGERAVDLIDSGRTGTVLEAIQRLGDDVYL